MRRLPITGYRSQTRAPALATFQCQPAATTRDLSRWRVSDRTRIDSRIDLQIGLRIGRRIGLRIGLLVIGLSLLVTSLGSLFGAPLAGEAAAQPGPGATTSPSLGGGAPKSVVAVVTVNGFIDPVLADFMIKSIDDANRVNATALIFQVDLQGSVVPDSRLAELILKMRSSAVPVDIWVGPTGSELAGKAGLLAAGAQKVAIAPGARLTVIDTKASASTREQVLDTKQAEDAKVATFAPTLGDFFVGLPNVETKETQVNGQTRREPVTNVVFSQLPLLDSFFHTVASPAVAYLLLAIGLSLLIFELFTAGVGVAGVLGAGSLIFASYGLAVLPTNWYGIALVLAAMVAFGIDVQTGIPRFWSGVGMAAFVVGSLTLFNGVSMSWLTMGVGIAGVALAFFMGMPSMVRTRFSTPTIGREWMIGEMGRAITDVNPDGVVQIKGAPWRAYTNRATPIEQLDSIRVVGIEGLVLEVEPEAGGARDYRERGPKDAAATVPTDNG